MEEPPSEQLPADWAMTSFDPWDPRITNRNVWDMYRAMRQAGPVVRSAAHGGFWSITCYDEIRTAAADFRTFSSGREGVVIGRRRAERATPLELDRPEHTRFRKAMAEPFFPKRIHQFADLVRGCMRELLDRVAEQQQFDIVHDVAEELPFRVISDFLGVPRGERRAQHRQLAINLVSGDLGTIDGADEAYLTFLREEVQVRRRAPGPDFISELLSVQVDGEGFTEEEVARMARALALAGHHTTINGIASLLLRMADEQHRRRYRNDPGVAPLAVEESLRIDAPIHLEARTATVATTIAGVDIPAGGRIALLFASGNHDDRVYPDPQRFDLDRQGPTNLAFGHGIHKCLGAPLARQEMSIALEGMLRRFPGYQLTAEPVATGMFFGHHMGWESIPAATNA